MTSVESFAPLAQSDCIGVNGPFDVANRIARFTNIARSFVIAEGVTIRPKIRQSLPDRSRRRVTAEAIVPLVPRSSLTAAVFADTEFEFVESPVPTDDSVPRLSLLNAADFFQETCRAEAL